MIRLAAAILLLTGAAAQAGTGADFCDALRKQSIACMQEAATRSGGDYLRKCPEAITNFGRAHTLAMAGASTNLKVEIGKASELWEEISTKPLPQIGETPSAFKSRKNNERDQINSACDQLQFLDSN